MSMSNMVIMTNMGMMMVEIMMKMDRKRKRIMRLRWS